MTDSALASRPDGAPEPGAAVPAFRFSTAEAPRSERVAAWRQAIGPLFDMDICDLTENRAFAATFTAYHFGGFLLCHSRVDGGRYTRSETRIQSDDLDHLLIHLVLGGAVVAVRPGAAIGLRAMDIGILDLAAPAALQIRCDEAISLILPRVAVPAAERQPGSLHGRVLDRRTATGAILARQMVALTIEAPRLRLPEAVPLGVAAAGVVATCLGLATAGVALPPVSVRRDLGRQVRAYIEDHLEAPELTPATIMRDLNLSRSQLYRQFEPWGGVRAYIRRRRLWRCLMALSHPVSADRRIGDIAYEHGFTDLEHFSRLFRQAFGLSPRAARAAARRGDASALAALAPGPEDGGTLARWIRTLAVG
ncbi:helix-turn-helix domain-containing protein [Roseospira goensis]|uniref:AraC-like DNA-binding protein n=1 Tax=Roseospira goensis TaxID=391922 RepID=A0A7W6RWH7_9PROT|nr:helix-turn-helix domain-containing protein [Roseospira goensis]MBB4284539.1 AraC-like DNA-binding protein [Roseospira goensis]